MENQFKYDVVIIGSGPAGYVAATRAAQVGLSTAIIEKDQVGGMCIGWGCVRMKSLLESATLFAKIKNAESFGISVPQPVADWDKMKERATEISGTISESIRKMLIKYGVDIIPGEAVLADEETISVGEKKIIASHIIIATGSVSSEPKETFRQAPVLDAKTLFNLEKFPDSVVVYGRGSVAFEMAQFFNLIGKHVTIVNQESNFLPGLDNHLQNFIVDKFQDSGIGFLSGNIDKYERGALFVDGIAVSCELIIDSSFRKAVIPKAHIPLELDSFGFIKTNSHFETSIKNVYAVGDVTGKSYLAHLASAQGISVVNHIKNIPGEFSSMAYPLNLYTFPEISQIGMTEETAKREGFHYKITEYPLSANSKAVISGNTDGFLRIISEKISGHILGVQIAAEHATDMISEAAAYMQMRGTVYDIAKSIHAHPTISEIFTEAGFKAIDSIINKK